MIGLDTNVLMLILVADDEEQATRAAALVRCAIEAEELLFVSDVALCEVVWVLESAHGIGRRQISTALQSLLEARQLVFRDRDALGRAVEAFAAGPGDFADCVVREVAREAGCESVATSDRALLKEQGFVRP